MNEGTRNLGESIRWPIIICLPHTPPSPAPPAAASDAAASDAAAAATAAQKGRHMPSLDAVSIILRGGGDGRPLGWMRKATRDGDSCCWFGW